MNASILNDEPAIRLGVSLGVFVAMALWEVAAARRELTSSKGQRWAANISLVVLNTMLLRLLVPAAAVAMALTAAERGWGLLNNVALPDAVAVVISVIVLDLTIYLQHVMFHAVPVLWQLHMVHHADVDLDVTSGTRFHPAEMLLSALIKLAVTVVLGPPMLAVLIFEVLLNATAMFNHANVRMPSWLDSLLRWVVVTPDMHRVHHSVEGSEANSNFGFNLPWWDRLGGTYRGQPAVPHEQMTLGVQHLLEVRHQTLPWLLALPFGRNSGSARIIRRETGTA